MERDTAGKKRLKAMDRMKRLKWAKQDREKRQKRKEEHRIWGKPEKEKKKYKIFTFLNR